MRLYIACLIGWGSNIPNAPHANVIADKSLILVKLNLSNWSNSLGIVDGFAKRGAIMKKRWISLSAFLAGFAFISITAQTMGQTHKLEPCGRLCQPIFWKQASMLDVQAEVQAGAQIDARDADGATTLHYAARYGHAEQTIFLVRAGAQLNARSYKGNTPLHHAARFARERQVKALTTQGAQINIINEEGLTPLHIAASDGNSQTIAALLEAGAQLEHRTPVGWTALHVAVWGGSDETVSALIEAGANVHSKSTAGSDVLDLARYNNALQKSPVYWQLYEAYYARVQ